jgi:UDP-N-acetylglucosamine 2-epimerase (non-hydrolysing)
MMRFLCVVGTRPEAIKLAPVILELKRRSQVTTLASGQHTKLAVEPLAWFGIKPDDRIALPAKSRTLAMLTGAMMAPMERMIAKHRPDIIVAQGDTTTVLVAALSAYYAGIPFAHVEAELRSGNLRAPFPEEFNRVAADRLARWHFCPTRRAVENLRGEGIEPARLYLTGNTAIDALRLTLERLAPAFAAGGEGSADGGPRRILLTAHRRENQGQRMESICRAVVALVEEFSDIVFIVPVHPSPAVRETFERLRGHDRVKLLPPLRYQDLVAEMARAHLILTDSGGIQEEAPFLKKPVLVLRHVTERPEAAELGLARLIGTDTAAIVGATRELLTDKALYAKMATGGSPYGDGCAAERIAAAFGLRQQPASAVG